MYSNMIISLLVLPGLVSSKTCPKISCGDLTYPRCYNYYEASGTGIAAKCPEDEYCDIGTDDNGMFKDDDDSPVFYNSTCEPAGSDDDNDNLPGQTCESSDLCINLEGVSCIDGKCQGLNKDQACFNCI